MPEQTRSKVPVSASSVFGSQKTLWIGLAIIGLLIVAYANYQLVKVAVESQPECMAPTGSENGSNNRNLKPAKKSC